VVLAQRVERDVLDDDHLAVVDVEDGAVDQAFGVDVIAGGQFRVHPVDALRRAGQALAVRVLADLHEDVPDGGLHPAVGALITPLAFDGGRGAAGFLADLGLNLVDHPTDMWGQIIRAGQDGSPCVRARWYAGSAGRRRGAGLAALGAGRRSRGASGLPICV
jgi:hypothetical protein